MDFEHRALDTWSENNLAPMLLEQFVEESFQSTWCEGNVRVCASAAIKILSDLHFCHDGSLDRCLVQMAESGGVAVLSFLEKNVQDSSSSCSTTITYALQLHDDVFGVESAWHSWAGRNANIDSRQTRDFPTVRAHEVGMFRCLMTALTFAFQLESPDVIPYVSAGEQPDFSQIDEIAINCCTIKPVVGQGFKEFGVADWRGRGLQILQHRYTRSRTP